MNHESLSRTRDARTATASRHNSDGGPHAHSHDDHHGLPPRPPNKARSKALLLTRGGISTCPMPQLTWDAVIAQINSFYQALTETTAPDSDRIATQQTLRQILE